MRKSILVLAGAIVIAAGGVSYAISGNQVITACVGDPAGGGGTALSLAPAGGCQPGQQSLSWNQQGPQGDPGAQGAQGVAGLKGAQGDPGSAASASTNVAFGPVTVKHRKSFSTQIDVTTLGTHNVTGHVHLHAVPTKWKFPGTVNCQLYVVGDSAPLDTATIPIAKHGPVLDLDIDLGGLVTIEPAPSSNTVQSIATTDRTVVFTCTTVGKIAGGLQTTFTFVSMTDTLLGPVVLHLPIKEAPKLIKIGPSQHG